VRTHDETRWEQVATGFEFLEGPVWHPDGYLIFSDIPGDTIYAIIGGETQIYRRPSAKSNGLAIDTQGRLLACEHKKRRVSLTQADGEIVVLASHYRGARLNSPNDVVVKSDGAIYFTDPAYGLDDGERELDSEDVYRIAPDGSVARVATGFTRPNGLAFSPDERILYIDDTVEQRIRTFDVRPDGALAGGETFAELFGPGEGRPDGMKVDARGNVHCTGPGGVWVFEPDGTQVAMWQTPERAANLAFGDEDGRTLYIAATSSVYRMRNEHAGAVVAGVNR